MLPRKTLTEAAGTRSRDKKLRNGDAIEMLGEQQMESDLEELWMDGPSIVNEEEQPRRKKITSL